jgi:hypothetical protein
MLRRTIRRDRPYRPVNPPHTPGCRSRVYCCRFLGVEIRGGLGGLRDERSGNYGCANGVPNADLAAEDSFWEGTAVFSGQVEVSRASFPKSRARVRIHLSTGGRSLRSGRLKHFLATMTVHLIMQIIRRI